MPVIDGRLTCCSCGSDLGDADDPYRDPDCATCWELEMEAEAAAEAAEDREAERLAELEFTAWIDAQRPGRASVGLLVVVAVHAVAAMFAGALLVGAGAGPAPVMQPDTTRVPSAAMDTMRVHDALTGAVVHVYVFEPTPPMPLVCTVDRIEGDRAVVEVWDDHVVTFTDAPAGDLAEGERVDCATLQAAAEDAYRGGLTFCAAHPDVPFCQVAPDTTFLAGSRADTIRVLEPGTDAVVKVFVFYSQAEAMATFRADPAVCETRPALPFCRRERTW